MAQIYVKVFLVCVCLYNVCGYSRNRKEKEFRRKNTVHGIFVYTKNVKRGFPRKMFFFMVDGGESSLILYILYIRGLRSWSYWSWSCISWEDKDLK